MWSLWREMPPAGLPVLPSSYRDFRWHGGPRPRLDHEDWWRGQIEWCSPYSWDAHQDISPTRHKFHHSIWQCSSCDAWEQEESEETSLIVQCWSWSWSLSVYGVGVGVSVNYIISCVCSCAYVSLLFKSSVLMCSAILTIFIYCRVFFVWLDFISLFTLSCVRRVIAIMFGWEGGKNVVLLIFVENE